MQQNNHLKMPKKCKICHKDSQYKYYNVQSCDGCKQFFRRAIVQQRTFECRKNALCNGTKCRSCRLDKCLLVGMDPMLVEVEESPTMAKFIGMLANRQKLLRGISENTLNNCKINHKWNEMEKKGTENWHGNAISVLPPSLTEKSMATYRILCSFNAVEHQIRRFIDGVHTFSDGILEQFDSIDQLLIHESLMHNLDKYMNPVCQLGPSKIYQMVAKFGCFNSKNFSLIKELISVVDLFRTLPHFFLLDMRDQAILLNYVATPVAQLNARFYSAKQNSAYQIIYNGYNFSPLFVYYNNPFYAKDTTVQTMSEALYMKSMEPFNRLKMKNEEFLLIRALMLTHSAIDSLSPRARAVLQQAAAHYSDLLMHHLRVVHGTPGAAARRFAELVHLAECVLRSAAKHRAFFNYLAAVTDQGRFETVIPKMLRPMILHGSVQ